MHMNGPVLDHRDVVMTQAEYDEACEKGRCKALVKIIHDPDARARVETEFGIEYCMKRYPEAYATHVLQ